MKLRRMVLTAALIMGMSALSQAQETSDTRTELWPEVDVYVPLSPKFRLIFVASLTKSEETRDNLETSFQASFDYRLNKKVSFRAAYRYAFSLSGEDPFKEHRTLFEQTFRQPLFLEILLSDRNREEIRVVNGKTSARYRNRVTLERDFSIKSRKLTPYVSGELYYDNRFDTWNRNRVSVGVQIPIRKGFPLISLIEPQRQIILDIYYTHQNDSRSQPNHIHAIGTSISFYF